MLTRKIPNYSQIFQPPSFQSKLAILCSQILTTNIETQRTACTPRVITGRKVPIQNSVTRNVLHGEMKSGRKYLSDRCKIIDWRVGKRREKKQKRARMSATDEHNAWLESMRRNYLITWNLDTWNGVGFAGGGGESDSVSILFLCNRRRAKWIEVV